MQAYGLVASAPTDELRQGLLALLGDSLFEAPAHLTRNDFRAMSGGPAIGHVQSFHVAVGNPFPGPNEGVAHHCVELIFLFEAFHNALAEADRGIRRPYTEPGHEATALPQQELGIPSSGPYKRTNIELCHEMQDFWLNFITADNWKPVGDPDSVVVYDKHRDTEIQSFSDDPAWCRRIQRWNLLAANPDAMQQLAEAIYTYRKKSM